MKWHVIRNHTSTQASLHGVEPPALLTTPRPTFSTKEDYRKWSIRSDTDFVFYSTFEPLNPHSRLSEENPPQWMHGWVADFDGLGIDTSDMRKLATQIAKDSPGGLKPTKVTKTFSNKARVIWEFEEPVPADSLVLLQKFTKEFIKKTKAERLLPGLDEASLSYKMYWEVGTDWTDIPGGAPIPAARLETIFFDACRNARVQVSETTVPLDVVEKEVHERFPGRWKGPFEEGARGPLFWIDDGIDRVGAQVTLTGMICYSSRAGTGFKSWGDLFGRSFVAAYEERRVEEAMRDVYFDGKRYWNKTASGHWQDLQKEDFMLRLKQAGFGYTTRNKGDTITEIEEALVHIQDHKRISGAAPFVFRKEELCPLSGETFLNIATCEAMRPAPAGDSDPSKWPFLQEYLTQIWDPHPINGVYPADYFMSWLQRAYVGAYERVPRSGHALFIAGPNDMGKSLLTVFLMRQIFGGAADAGDFLLSGGGFNKAMGECGLWYVDDNKSAASASGHRRFGEVLKKHVATPQVNYHPKYRDVVTLPWAGRLIVTCNIDADSIAIVPSLDGTILDKLMLFKLRTDGWRPDFKESHVMEPMLRAELPHFLSYLLHDYEPPKAITEGASPRFGMHPYHHPDIVDEARDSNPDHRVVEILGMWIEFKREIMKPRRDGTFEPWKGNSTELMSELASMDDLRPTLKNLNPITLGKALRKISEYYKPLSATRTGSKRQYVISFD